QWVRRPSTPLSCSATTRTKAIWRIAGPLSRSTTATPSANGNAQHGTYSDLPDWYIRNRAAFFEPVAPRDYPIHAPLALHLIETLLEAEFDVASSKSLRAGEGEGHAMAYVHRHVMDTAEPIPIVPIFINTYFLPNQPSPPRCYKLGQAVRRAVDTYPGNLRVGVLASGGL